MIQNMLKQSLDFNKLDYYIADYENRYNSKPDLIMSEETLRKYMPIRNYPKSLDNVTGVQGNFEGYFIFIDNELELGDIDIQSIRPAKTYNKIMEEISSDNQKYMICFPKEE